MAQLKIYAKPSSLYRYRPLGQHAEREVEALLKGYIYCPAFADMNCQSASKKDPLSACKRDPLRRAA